MELTQTAREETAEEMQDVEDLTQRGPEDQGLEEQQAEQQLPANAAGARVQRRVRGAPAAAPAPPCPGKARDSPSPAPGTSGRSRYRRTVVSAHDTAAVTFKLGCALTFVFLACALWEVFLLPLRARRMHSVSSAGCAPSRPPCPGKAMAQTPVGCNVPQLIAQDPEGTKVYIYSKYHGPANSRGFAGSGTECTVWRPGRSIRPCWEEEGTPPTTHKPGKQM